MNSPVPTLHPQPVGLVPLVQELWARIWQGKYWIVAGAAAGIIVALVIASVAERKYSVEMVLSPQTSEMGEGGLGAIMSQLGGIGSLIGLSMGGNGGEVNAVATLKGRGFTAAFIRENNLAPHLFPKKWDSATGTWKKRQPTDNELVDEFERSGVRDVIEDRRTGLVTVRMRWHDPKQAATILQRMVDSVNAGLRDRAIDESRKNIEFLKAELDRTNVLETRETINMLLGSHLKQIALASARQDYAFRIVDPLIVPEEPDYVWPKWILLAAVGLVLGGMLGFAAHLIMCSSTRNGTSKQ